MRPRVQVDISGEDVWGENSLEGPPSEAVLNIVDDKPYKNLVEVFDNLSLTHIQKEIIKLRFTYIVKEYKNHLKYLDVIYNIFRLFISLGGISVPALLSIQSNNTSQTLYWITWSISLGVSFIHTVFVVFKYEKKYFVLHSTLENLQSEGWHYTQLSGRYSGNPNPTHSNQFVLFVNTVESLKISQVKDEYRLKEVETKKHKPQSSSTNLPS